MSRKKRDIDIVSDLFNRKSGIFSITRIIIPGTIFFLIGLFLYRIGLESNLFLFFIFLFSAPFSLYYGFSEDWRVVISYIIIIETLFAIFVGPNLALLTLLLLPIVFYNMRDIGVFYAFVFPVVIGFFLVKLPSEELFANKPVDVYNLLVHGKSIKYEEPCKIIENIKNTYALYENPTYTSKKIKSFNSNEKVCMYYKKEKNDFIFLKDMDNNISGWGNLDLEDSNLECKKAITTANLRIRRKPSSDSEKIGILKKNTEICIESSVNKWSYIKDNGWVSNKFIRENTQ